MSALADGAFSVEVRQLDARGNPGNWLSSSYFQDTSPPSEPGAPQIALAADGWINKADAQSLRIVVSLAGTGAEVGDTVRVLARGSGFAITADAQALSAGFEGRPARLKSANGRVITAVPVGARRAEMLL
jgi:flagella basal body P-ring formation protein FlgA